MYDMSKKYIMRITGRENIYDTVSANTIEEVLSEIKSLGCDFESEKEEFIDWLGRAYPTCKMFLQNFSVEWLGNFRQ